MKKIQVLLIVFATFPLLIYAQQSKKACTPDTTMQETGYYPRELPPGIAGQNYQTIVQFKFPEDTVISNITIPIDSLYIKDISGMPEGYQYACNISSCVYPGGSNGCVKITGNPADSMIGSYNITIKLIGYVSNPFPFTDSINYEVSYEIIEDQPSSIQESGQSGRVDVWPQPAHSDLNLRIPGPRGKIHTIVLMDINGRIMLQRNVSSDAVLDISGLDQGIYFYTVYNNDDQYRGKLVKE